MRISRSRVKLQSLRWRRASHQMLVEGVWRALLRVHLVGRQLLRSAWWGLRWLVLEREALPDAYALTPRNRLQLAAYLATVGEASLDAVMEYIDELEEDKALREHLRAGPPEVARLADGELGYGCRVAAYVLTRLRRPRTVVETGVGAGLVGCVVVSALERNAAEGQPGFYFGLDSHAGAGRLLSGRYERHGWILAGAPLEALKEIEQVDLYFHSRSGSREQESREYETLASRLSDDALVVSSTAHETDALYDFAAASNRGYLFFAEEPEAHWYRGAGLGTAFV